MWKHRGCLVIFFISFCGCSEISVLLAQPETDGGITKEKHDEITQNSLLADFVNSISNNKYNFAFSMLHSKLSEAWTMERFALDWNDVKKQLKSGWNPQATGSFSGYSSQGPYDQASYRLESNWRSIASLTLVSIKVDGEAKIVQVHIRLPRDNAPPNNIVLQTNAFIEAMIREDYDTALSLFSVVAQKQYTPVLLSRVKNILGDTSSSASRSYHRFFANSVWYEAVVLKQPNDPATHLELIMQADSAPSKIVSLTFKGRM